MTSANPRVKRGSILALAIASIALMASLFASRTDQSAKNDIASRRLGVARAYGQLPLSFEPNVGQARTGVDYLARGAGFSVYLSPAAATLALADTALSSRAGGPNTQVVRINLEGANRDSKASGGGRLPGVANYFVGSNPANWHSGVPTFADVKYSAAYTGIDVVYHGQNGRVEFDFDIAAGADPSRILMGGNGAGRLDVDSGGDAGMRAGKNSITLRKPAAWQTRDGIRRPVEVRYRIANGNKLAFELSAYDRSSALTIDPAITYSSYIGGSLAQANAIAVDGSGHAYIAGWASDTCVACEAPFPTP